MDLGSNGPSPVVGLLSSQKKFGIGTKLQVREADPIRSMDVVASHCRCKGDCGVGVRITGEN